MPAAHSTKAAMHISADAEISTEEDTLQLTQPWVVRGRKVFVAVVLCLTVAVGIMALSTGARRHTESQVDSGARFWDVTKPNNQEVLEDGVVFISKDKKWAAVCAGKSRYGAIEDSDITDAVANMCTREDRTYRNAPWLTRHWWSAPMVPAQGQKDIPGWPWKTEDRSWEGCTDQTLAYSCRLYKKAREWAYMDGNSCNRGKAATFFECRTYSHQFKVAPNTRNGKWRGKGNYGFMPYGCNYYSGFRGTMHESWVVWNYNKRGNNDGNRKKVCVL